MIDIIINITYCLYIIPISQRPQSGRHCAGRRTASLAATAGAPPGVQLRAPNHERASPKGHWQ